MCKDFKDTGYARGLRVEPHHTRRPGRARFRAPAPRTHSHPWHRPRCGAQCGYGDACKFLHDRSDYKSGWQLDKMWEEEQKELKNQEALVALGESEAAQKTDPADHLPFACLICREPWHAGSAPVQTKCEHFFCERCAIEHFQKSRRCFACSEQTGGIFNKAKAIQEKIDRLKVAEEVASAEDMTQEQLNAEYEASKESSKRRGYTGGWGMR